MASENIKNSFSIFSNFGFLRLQHPGHLIGKKKSSCTFLWPGIHDLKYDKLHDSMGMFFSKRVDISYKEWILQVQKADNFYNNNGLTIA